MTPDSPPPSSGTKPAPTRLGLWTKNISLAAGTLGLAVVSGMVLGELFPPPKPTAPLFWQGIAALFNPSPSSGEVLDEAVLALTDEELTSLEVEVKSLTQEFQALNDRLGRIANKVVIDPKITGVKDQLAAIDQKLNLLDQSNMQAALPSDRGTQLTLPLNLLFAPNSTQLSSSGEELLPDLVQDLASGSGDTLRIAVHSSDGTKQLPQQKLSFQRAKRVQQLLKSYLGENYRWIIVGYGSQTLPLASGSDQAKGVNERLEISVISPNP
ncbi:MAG: OmpA family protein [Synechococcaceae cyanobacterium RL_1_2]|nr:OmpA family protein [Synechococcaceae cyanobacterium RL_1_2]